MKRKFSGRSLTEFYVLSRIIYIAVLMFIYLSQIQSYSVGCLLRAELDASAPGGAAARATCPDNPDYTG